MTDRHRFGWVICSIRAKPARYLKIDGNTDSWWIASIEEAYLFRSRETAERFIVTNDIRNAAAIEHFG